MSSYKPSIVDLKKAGINEKDGLYEFTMNLADGTACRVFYQRNPEWKLMNVSRLQKTPCPVCRKDYICKCMDQYEGELNRQMQDDQWIEKALAE
ncbi:hypothetical protein Q5741_12815 [Paenibacillus sp. JX-17]|uniref:Uncharacterized protein n=1 Tax=Paenibacillus lacisoli TaxID=3064525 RepID=A0ABT9CI47_9BACL|nr:hypothetical protein [Paenibacillus sp. JX-17]MDO7907288.1 hypothetical protein [Paenibacillus sp. JX-17]